MDNKTVENAFEGLTDLIAMLWNNIVMPVVDGIGALLRALPPEVTGIIAGILLIIFAYRKARNG